MDIGTIEAALKLRDDSAPVIARFNKNLSGLTQNGREIGESMTRIGVAITTGVIVPLVAVIKTAKDFESAFANVVKTVEGFDVDAFGTLNEDAQAFRDSIIDLSREIPVAADALANIAGIGGQFGVAQQDLLGFTETVAKLGVAVDGIEAETAAAALAQIANVTREGAGAFVEYANVLVDLGNKGNSTEAEILEFSKRLAGAGSQAGLTGSEIFGLGAAMANVGLNAEAGGTAMSRLLSQMSRAGAEGEAASQKFADFAGRIDASAASGAGFAKIFKEDASKALELFFDGLADAATNGENLNVILTDLGVNEVRQRDTMLRLAGAQGELARSFNIAGQAAKDQTALNEEARKKFATFDNQLKLFLNSVRAVAIEIGTPLLRAMNSALQAMKPLTDSAVELARVFATLPPAVHQATLVLGVGAGITGVLIVLGGQIARSVADLGRLAAAIRALTAAQAASSLVSTASAVASLGGAATSTTANVVRMTSATNAWGYSMQVAAPATVAASTGLRGMAAAALGSSVAMGGLIGLGVGLLSLLDRWADSAGNVGTFMRAIVSPTRAVSVAIRDLISNLDLYDEAIDRIKGKTAEPTFIPLAPTLFSGQAPKLELPTSSELNEALNGTKKTQEGIESLKAAVRALSPEIRAQIDDWAAWGKTTEQISKDLRITEDVVKAYQTTSASAAKAQKELAKETDVASEAFAQMAKDSVGAVERLLELSGALDATKFDEAKEQATELAAAMREVQDSIDVRRATQGLSKEWRGLATDAKAFAREVDALTDKFKDADPEIRTMADRLIELKRIEFAEAFEEAVVQTEEFRAVLMAVNPQMAIMLQMAEASAEAQGMATEKTKDWTESLSGIATAMANLKDLGGGLGFAAQFIAQADVALQSFGKVREGIKEFAKGAKADLVAAFSDMAAGIASGLAGVIGATDPSKDLGDRLLGGALQGASLGASAAALGATIAGATAKGAAVAGVWGAAAGLIVGIMIAVFRGRKTRREMEIVGAEWGVSISKGLFDAIQKTMDEQGFGRVEAALFNMSDIISEAGGLNDLNFDQFTSKLRDVFVALETGKFTTEQALHVIEENFDAFAQHVIQSGEFAGKEFIEILNLNMASGLNSPEIRAFIEGRSAVIGSGLAAMLGPVLEGAAQVGERVRKAFTVVDDLIAQGKQGTDEFIAASGELNEALRHQREVAAGAIGDLENIGVIALSTFTRARASGLSFVEALSTIGPALDVLIQAQKDLGIEGTNSAINQLIHYRELANQFPVLVAAASALAPTLVAIQQSGGLTTEALAAMEDQGLRTFHRLRDAGFTEAEALAQIADFLKQVEKAHKLLGSPIDENTQRMIDQARAAGLMGDEAVDATTQQRRGFELVTRAINALIVTLGGVPIAIDDISKAIDDIPKDVVVNVGFDIEDLPNDFPGRPGSPRTPEETPPPEFPDGPTGPSPYGPGGPFDPATVAAATRSAAQTSGMGVVYVEVPVEIDGEVVTRVVARRLPDYTELYGGPSARTTI